MKRIIYIIVLSINLFAIDSDFDGVDDALDRCQNTPFYDLVDMDGCSTESLISDIHYDIIMGVGTSQMNYASGDRINTATTTINADYYFRNITASIATSYFNSKFANSTDKGWNDTTISVNVKSKPKEELILQVGAGIVLPTYHSRYNNEAMDYTGLAGFNYGLNKDYNLFGGASYTIVKDRDIANVVEYRNTKLLYAGVRYIINNFSSASISYSSADSIYGSIGTINSGAIGYFYQVNQHWFVVADYKHGLSNSASKHDASLRMGYYF